MLRLDDDADARRLQNVLDRFGDFGGELFLNLQAAREAVHDARELRNADDAIVRQIADMRAAGHRQHVMLAEADDANVLEHDEFVIAADLVEGALEIVARIDVIAGEKLAIGARHTLRRVDQTLAIGIVARPFDENPHGRFGVSLGGFGHACSSPGSLMRAAQPSG